MAQLAQDRGVSWHRGLLLLKPGVSRATRMVGHPTPYVASERSTARDVYGGNERRAGMLRGPNPILKHFGGSYNC